MNKVVLMMAIIRLLSGLIEISAASLMVYFNKIETAFKINAVLAIVGPLVLITVTSLGLIGLADKINIKQLVMIFCGVALIFIALNKL